MLELEALPNTPKIGSTMPLNWPYQKLLARENPLAWSGSETAKPSGKFWIPEEEIRFMENEISLLTPKDSPIPIARFRAASKVAFDVDPIAPKLTPTARPSRTKNLSINVVSNLIRYLIITWDVMNRDCRDKQNDSLPTGHSILQVILRLGFVSFLLTGLASLLPSLASAARVLTVQTIGETVHADCHRVLVQSPNRYHFAMLDRGFVYRDVSFVFVWLRQLNHHRCTVNSEVCDHFISGKDEDGAKQKANRHRHESISPVTPIESWRLCQFNCWCKKRPETCGNHNTSTEAQAYIQSFSLQ